MFRGINVRISLFSLHYQNNSNRGFPDGLAYAGVGWALWRSKAFLPEEILFTVNYLGSPQVSFTLNFSKSCVQVVGQYYQLLRLGKAGYRAIMTNLTQTADFLAESVVKFGGGEKFVLMSKTGGEGLPLVAWRLKNEEDYDGVCSNLYFFGTVNADGLLGDCEIQNSPSPGR